MPPNQFLGLREPTAPDTLTRIGSALRGWRLLWQQFWSHFCEAAAQGPSCSDRHPGPEAGRQSRCRERPLSAQTDREPKECRFFGDGLRLGRVAPGARRGRLPMGVVEVLDPVQPARAGGWKVDVSRGERNGRVSSEWFNRPDDERYLSLDDLWASVKGRSERSRSRVVQTADIRVEAARDSAERLHARSSCDYVESGGFPRGFGCDSSCSGGSHLARTALARHSPSLSTLYRGWPVWP